jgi:hypothetical protein
MMNYVMLTCKLLPANDEMIYMMMEYMLMNHWLSEY